jgi:hypothetical protein
VLVEGVAAEVTAGSQQGAAWTPDVDRLAVSAMGVFMILP